MRSLSTLLILICGCQSLKKGAFYVRSTEFKRPERCGLIVVDNVVLNGDSTTLPRFEDPMAYQKLVRSGFKEVAPHYNWENVELTDEQMKVLRTAPIRDQNPIKKVLADLDLPYDQYLIVRKIDIRFYSNIAASNPFTSAHANQSKYTCNTALIGGFYASNGEMLEFAKSLDETGSSGDQYAATVFSLKKAGRTLFEILTHQMPRSSLVDRTQDM